MNEADQAAFEAWLETEHYGLTIKADKVWHAALKYVRDAQPPDAQGEPIAKVKHEFENCIGWNPKIDPYTLDEDTPLFLVQPAVAVNEQMLEALHAAVACGMVPISSAKEGGAVSYSIQVQVADQIREAIEAAKKLKGGE